MQNAQPIDINCLALCYRYPQGEGTEQPHVLQNVDFTAKRGEFIAVLGRNGSGKSTFARHINALLTPTDGEVWVKGMDTRDEKNLVEIRRAAGMVFQNPDNQLVNVVVEDDVAFGPENIGVEPGEIRRRVDDALNAVGMGEFALRAPHMLSGGQKQRIAIAGVLALKPDIVLLDEPTAMLDPFGRAEVMKAIESLVGDGITVVLITHFMQEAAGAHRVVVMDEGRVVMDGPPQEVFSRREEVMACGLELPPLEELKHLLAREGINLPGKLYDAEGMAQAICQSISKT